VWFDFLVPKIWVICKVFGKCQFHKKARLMEMINFLILLYWWNRSFCSLRRIFMSYLYILTDWSGKLEEITIYLRQKGLCTHFYCIIIYWNRISLYLYKCWLMLFINVGVLLGSHKLLIFQRSAMFSSSISRVLGQI